MEEAELDKREEQKPDPVADPVAEKALEAINSGKSLDQAAKDQGLHKTTLVRHLISNPTYEQRYARAMVSKGVIYADEIVSIPDALSEDPTPGELAKARMRVEARQWAATKFWQHLTPEKVAKAQVNIQNNADGLSITFVGDKETAETTDTPLRESTDEVIDIET